MLIDTDQDGVADYLDLKKTAVSGVMLILKVELLTLNKNNVPDERRTI
jgi:OOP family OmpA-OmpF porin